MYVRPTAVFCCSMYDTWGGRETHSYYMSICIRPCVFTGLSGVRWMVYLSWGWADLIFSFFVFGLFFQSSTRCEVYTAAMTLNDQVHVVYIVTSFVHVIRNCLWTESAAPTGGWVREIRERIDYRL